MTAKNRERWFFGACTAIVIGLVLFEPTYGWQVRAWLTGNMGGVIAAGANGNEAALTAENESLKAQLAAFASVAAQLPTSSANYERAMVYSRYPWNFKNELTVNGGAAEGIVNGKAAVFEGVLIGVVDQVFPDEATIETVFDNNFKLPVRIGAVGNDALLVGGAAPKATLVSKKAVLAPGDVVYAAAPGIPYGLPVGIVAATSTSADGLFQEATLNFAYDMNTLQTILIAK